MKKDKAHILNLANRQLNKDVFKISKRYSLNNCEVVGLLHAITITLVHLSYGKCPDGIKHS